MDIKESLSWLDSLINYEKGSRKYTDSTFQVGRMCGLLDKISDTWQAIPLAHIAGTKGKGSIARYISSGIKFSGKKVGLFTSPHYFTLNERIAINNRSISDDELAHIITRHQSVIIENGLSYFEALTYLAMAAFIEQGCDAIVLETGMGGRLDSTNFHPAPTVTIISAISYDHTAILGNTLSQIAGEKAGIIKPGRPVISVEQKPEVLSVLKEKAAALEAPWYYMSRVMSYQVLKKDTEGSHILLERIPGQRSELVIRQWGEAYIDSLTAALQALSLMGIDTDDSLVEALAAIRFPFHIQQQGQYILDVSHNAASIELLFRSVKAYAGVSRFKLYLGILQDKELERIGTMMQSYKEDFISVNVFEIPHSERPSGHNEMMRVLEQKGLEPHLLQNIDEIQASDDELVLVTGSFYSIPYIAPILGFSLDVSF